jgi:hypothetical protein
LVKITRHRLLQRTADEQIDPGDLAGKEHGRLAGRVAAADEGNFLLGASDTG